MKESTSSPPVPQNWIRLIRLLERNPETSIVTSPMGCCLTSLLARLMPFDPPNPLKKGASDFKVPLFKGDLGGSRFQASPTNLLSRLKQFFCFEKISLSNTGGSEVKVPQYWGT